MGREDYRSGCKETSSTTREGVELRNRAAKQQTDLKPLSLSSTATDRECVVMRAMESAHRREFRNTTERTESERTSVGYSCLSIDTQATDGLSLDAQTSAFEQNA